MHINLNPCLPKVDKDLFYLESSYKIDYLAIGSNIQKNYNYIVNTPILLTIHKKISTYIERSLLIGYFCYIKTHKLIHILTKRRIFAL